MLKGKMYATRRIGRPRIRWLEDVITDLRRMGISGWMEKARNRDQWRRISGDWSLRRPRITQGCNVGKKKKKNILCFLYLYKTNKLKLRRLSAFMLLGQNVLEKN